MPAVKNLNAVLFFSKMQMSVVQVLKQMGVKDLSYSFIYKCACMMKTVNTHDKLQ